MSNERDESVYAGWCERCEQVHRLPRTPEAEAAARALLRDLAARPTPSRGKMVGVLLTCDAQGRRETLCAYSGRLDGAAGSMDWVPPVPERDTSAEEADTFARIETINDAIARCLDDPVVAAVRAIERAHEADVKAANAALQRARELSRRGIEPGGVPLGRNEREGRRLREAREAKLAPLRAEYEAIMREVTALRAERKARSRALHTQMREAYILPNPAGRRRGLEQAQDSSAPLRGGVGECCAPKLLVAATRRGRRPLAMAECWWGPASGDGKRQPGRFYGPCERCQPLLGHLLCDGGLRIVHQDDHILVVDKPAGLPSVPGRTPDKHDSVQTRAQLRFPEARAVHRLDVDTSGLLLLALDAAARRGLSAAFAAREVEKRYVALLERVPEGAEGLVELRSGPDPDALPRQKLLRDGRVGRTPWRVLDGRRVEFRPLEGRTHQIRLAALHGLGVAIEGDALYGRAGERLMLHAEALALHHPITGERVAFRAPAPF